jgi:phage FluMu protein Com
VSNEVQDDVRCSACGKLLARLRDRQLTLQRGDSQVTIHGDFTAAFVCGHPRCRRLNVVRVRSHPAPSAASTP